MRGEQGFGGRGGVSQRWINSELAWDAVSLSFKAWAFIFRCQLAAEAPWVAETSPFLKKQTNVWRDTWVRIGLQLRYHDTYSTFLHCCCVAIERLRAAATVCHVALGIWALDFLHFW